MNITYYLQHYFKIPDIILFFLLTLGLVLVMNLVLRVFVKKDDRYSPDEKEKRFHSLKERLYEVIFSGTSILFFIAVYYLIDRFVTTGAFRTFWDKYVDFLLLGLLILSCLLNDVLDHYIIKLKNISSEEMASGRMIGMLYMFAIFTYIKFLYEDNNYDKFITYFLGLMIGRFVYFDASFKDFKASVKMASRNFFLMLMALCSTAIMALIGFSTDYLIKHNGVVTNLFIAHLFLCLSIAVVERIRFMNQNRTKEKKSNEISDTKSK